MTRKGPAPYKAYIIDADGKKKRVAAYKIIIEVAPAHEIELDLAPHENHHGGLPIRAGTECSLEDLQKSGHCSALVVRPGACNVVHLFVERHPWQPVAEQLTRSCD